MNIQERFQKIARMEQTVDPERVKFHLNQWLQYFHFNRPAVEIITEYRPMMYTSLYNFALDDRNSSDIALKYKIYLACLEHSTKIMASGHFENETLKADIAFHTVFPQAPDVAETMTRIAHLAMYESQNKGTDYPEFWQPLFEAAEAGAWFIICRRARIFVGLIPEVVRLDEQHRPHSEQGPALKWNNFQSYRWHGVNVPKHVIDQPEQITLAQIHAQRNVETRRVMIERYGYDRLETRIVSRRTLFGRRYLLLESVMVDDEWEPIRFVRVTNATPEPDGSSKQYYLRVPPHISNAIAAIAWTFNMSVEEYHELTAES